MTFTVDDSRLLHAFHGLQDYANGKITAVLRHFREMVTKSFQLPEKNFAARRFYYRSDFRREKINLKSHSKSPLIETCRCPRQC